MNNKAAPAEAAPRVAVTASVVVPCAPAKRARTTRRCAGPIFTIKVSGAGQVYRADHPEDQMSRYQQ